MAAASRAGCRIEKGYNSIKGGWVGADAATALGASAALPQASTGGWGRARMVGGKPRAPRGEGGPGYPTPSGARGPSGYRPPIFIIMSKLSAGASVAAPRPII